MDYFKKKIKFKYFRMTLINELNKNTKKRKMKEMRFIEEIYPFFMLNAFLGGFFLFRKDPVFIRIIASLGNNLNFRFYHLHLSLFHFLRRRKDFPLNSLKKH
jgi:hypothetical protein